MNHHLISLDSVHFTMYPIQLNPLIVEPGCLGSVLLLPHIKSLFRRECLSSHALYTSVEGSPIKSANNAYQVIRYRRFTLALVPHVFSAPTLAFEICDIRQLAKMRALIKWCCLPVAFLQRIRVPII